MLSAQRANAALILAAIKSTRRPELPEGICPPRTKRGKKTRRPDGHGSNVQGAPRDLSFG